MPAASGIPLLPIFAYCRPSLQSRACPKQDARAGASQGLLVLLDARVWQDGEPALSPFSITFFPFSITSVSEPFVCRHRHRVFICLKPPGTFHVAKETRPQRFSLELNDNKTCPDVSCRESQGLGDLTANKTNLWMCGLGICACFHVTLWVWVLFFEANLRFPDRAVFKMPAGVRGWSGDC